MSKLNFLSNNTNGLRSSEKRIKVFQHLKQKISGNGIILLQETHSSEDTFTEWKDDFAGEIFFSYRLTISCGVMSGYLGNSTFNADKISKDNEGRILIIDAEIGDDAFVLINLYNSNTEAEQLQSLSKFDQLLEDFCLDTKYYFCRRFQLMFRLDVRKSRWKSIVKKQIYLKHFANL